MRLNVVYHCCILLGLFDLSTAVKAGGCNFPDHKKIIDGGISCRTELNNVNGYIKNISLNFNPNLIIGKAPFITTKATLLEEVGESHKTDSFLDVVAYTSTGPSLWSYTKDQNGLTFSRYLYILESEHQNTTSQGIPIRLLFSTTTNKRVRFEISLEFKDVVITQHQTSKLTYGAPIIYKYINVENKNKRIRVHVTRSDIEDLRTITKKRKGCSASMAHCSCSVVTIQDLNTSFNQEERDVVFKSAWQTMIGRAVLDVDVGPNQTTYQNGFYIVILKKRNDNDCKINDLDLTLDGEAQEKATKDKVISDETAQNVTLINAANDTLSKTLAVTQRLIKEDSKKFDIEISEISNEIEGVSGIVLGIYVGLIVLSLVLSGAITGLVPITGRVRSDEPRFSGLLKLLLAPRCPPKETEAKDNPPDCVDGARAINNGVGESDAGNVEMAALSNEEGKQPSNKEQKSLTQSRKVSTNRHSLNPTNIKNAECFYIEIWNDSEEEDEGEANIVGPNKVGPHEDSEIDAVDGKMSSKGHESIYTSPEIRLQLKNALALEPKQSIRVIPRTRKTEIRKIRKNTDEAMLSNFATMCDPSMFPKTLYMKSDMYYWIMILSGIFYVLPAMQLMLAAQRISGQTGSQDLCYYNFLCRRTSAHFQDYGHIYSNISYLLCGFYFIIAVAIRSHRRKKAMVKMYYERKHPKLPRLDETDKEDKAKLACFRAKFEGKNVEFLNKCGIPEQYGIFYALGIALILEGVLSACYHVCPVDESFQFDTTFMYMITVMIFLKMYQFRHPDITANAYVIYLFIAIMLIFEAIGYYSSPGVYMFIFIITYLFLIFAVIIDLYFQKSFRLAMKEIFGKRFGTNISGTTGCGDANSSAAKALELGKDLKTGSTGRTVFFIIMALINFCVAVFCLYRMSKATNSIVSNYLLMMFGVNMFGYKVNYAVMKCYYAIKLKKPNGRREKISLTCWVYIMLTLVFGVSGLIFFKGYQEKTTMISPSESRHLNAECTLWFFDKHDIWHFASAFGLLFMFMTLLTLEDNNTSTPWEEIPVF